MPPLAPASPPQTHTGEEPLCPPASSHGAPLAMGLVSQCLCVMTRAPSGPFFASNQDRLSLTCGLGAAVSGGRAGGCPVRTEAEACSSHSSWIWGTPGCVWGDNPTHRQGSAPGCAAPLWPCPCTSPTAGRVVGLGSLPSGAACHVCNLVIRALCPSLESSSSSPRAVHVGPSVAAWLGTGAAGVCAAACARPPRQETHLEVQGPERRSGRSSGRAARMQNSKNTVTFTTATT